MLEIQIINDIKGIMDRYGDRVTCEYAPNPFILYDTDVDYDGLRKYAREIVDGFGAHVTGGSGVVLNLNFNDAERYRVFETEIIEYSMKQYANL